jgi:glycosyltransferase involved in cell wall biosynthesis
MRKILIFSLVYYPRYVGGAEVAVKEITDSLCPAGLCSDASFDMITLNAGGESKVEKFGGIHVYRVLNKVSTITKLLYPFIAYRKAVALHRENNYDVVWSIMASYAGFASYLFKKKFINIPIVLTIQEGDHFNRRSGIFKSLFVRIFKSADIIQAISNFLADWSKSMGATCPIKVIPNAVDVDLFSKAYTQEELSFTKNILNKKDDDIFLITTSRLVEKNAVSDIIKSLTYLPENVKLLVLGTGKEEYMLKELSTSLKLNDRVKFLGFIPHKEMPIYLKVSDIFVRPSLTEGLGNSFLEAMASGLPVIATPVGGIIDFLIDGETGLFCEVKNPKSIAQKVEKLIKDPESRDYIQKRAYNMVIQKYNWQNVSKAMNDIFNNHD